MSQVPSGSVKAQEQRRIGEKMLDFFSQFLLSYQGDPGELYECAGFSEFLKLSLRDGSYNPCTSSPSAESEAEKHRLNVNLPVLRRHWSCVAPQHASRGYIGAIGILFGAVVGAICCVGAL